jgi:hypothetical protein
VAQDLDQARRFIADVDLSGTPRSLLPQDAATEASEVFDAAKSQAQVVGSGLFSFVQGITADTRASISDCALLAQLVANKAFSFETAPLDWYSRYQEVLQNVGWVVQSKEWSDYTASGAEVDVHEKVVEVLGAALGPSVTAMAIIKSAIGTLKAMNPESSWITIFKREAQRARIARFQVGLIEPGQNGDVLISMLACLIEAKSSFTQVLVVKITRESASFKASSATASVNPTSLTRLRSAIRSKIRAYQVDYVSSIKDL